MRYLLFVATLIVLLCGFCLPKDGVDPDYNPPHYAVTLDSENLQEDFQLLRTELLKYHPDLDLYTSHEELDALASDILKNLNREMSVLDFYREMRPFVSAIRNGHTSLIYPQSFYDRFDGDGLRLPFSMYPYNDSLYVLIDASDEYVIKEGATILSINNKSFQQLYEDGRNFFPTDGYNVNWPDWRMARNISLYFALAYGSPSTYNIDYIDQDGVRRSSQIKAIDKKRSFENLNDGRVYYKNKNEGLRLSIDGDIAILTIPSFFPKSERRFANELRKHFATMENQNIDKLIIDVRGNGGGYFESASEVLKYLISDPIQPFKYEYAIVDRIKEPHHFMNGHLNHFHRQRIKESNSRFYSKSDRIRIKPHKYGYKGALVVLQNQLSYSAAADFLGLSKSYTSAVHIGAESGGNPVAQVAVELPQLVLPHSGLRVQLPLFRTELNTTFPNPKRGLVPDIEIIPTVHDLIVGFDVQMDRAKAYLENQSDGS